METHALSVGKDAIGPMPHPLSRRVAPPVWKVARCMRTMRMDLLRTFTAVTELGSSTTAGEAMGGTQPAISP